MILFQCLATLVLMACGDAEQTDLSAQPAAREFVGSEECVDCHSAEFEKWRGSDHDRAMELASPDTVLGRFDGSQLRGVDRSWRFVRDADAFFVELEELGRPVERLQVTYTFGFDPLQQYLVARPDGRMQALPSAWDARPEKLGGQRWFDLQPDERIAAEDPLHWERLAYNWNSQCAACHSTNLSKGYHEKEDRFATTWSVIDVGCEACHGPASEHVARRSESGSAPFEASELSVAFETWNPTAWRRSPETRIATREVPRSLDAEIEVCAPCHSRRSQIVDTPSIGAPYLDGHLPRLIDPGLYFDDGQIRDEVYVWGSFLQSRMYAAGVRCDDCHDPHSLELRREGEALCAGCHDRAAYETTAHHGHEPDSAGSRCVACHMPEHTYMQVDGRRDHSFAVPRPGRSAVLGSPSVCQTCHADRATEWASAAIDSWRREGATTPPHWSDHLVNGSQVRMDPDRWLEIALEPRWTPIVRANAWQRYAEEGEGMPALAVLEEVVQTGTELERLAVIDLARRLTPESRVRLLRPLLEDERLAIRASSAEALVDLPANLWQTADRNMLARGLAEYRAMQIVNAERPEAQVSLGLLAVQYGDLEAAGLAYHRAIGRAAYFVPAYANLADLERMQGRNVEALAWLAQAVERAPDDPLIRYAFGLALHRTGQSAQALVELERAFKAAPGAPRLVLGWALALDGAGRGEEAVGVLSGAVDRGVSSGDVHHSLVTLLRDQGRLSEARERVASWLRAMPDDRRAEALRDQLAAGESSG